MSGTREENPLVLLVVGCAVLGAVVAARGRAWAYARGHVLDPAVAAARRPVRQLGRQVGISALTPSSVWLAMLGVAALVAAVGTLTVLVLRRRLADDFPLD